MTVAQDFLITWDASPSKLVRKYRVLGRESGAEFKLLGETVLPEYRLTNVEWATYDIAVVAVGINGNESVPTIVRHQVEGLERNLLAVTGITLVDEPTSTTFESQSPKVSWTAHPDPFVVSYNVSIRNTGQTLLYGPVATELTEFVIPYEALKAIGAPRTFVIEIVAVDKFAFRSIPAQLTVNNPAPSAPSSLTLVPGLGVCQISAALPNIRDLGGFVVAVGTTAGFPPNSNIIHQGPTLSYQFVGTTQTTYYVRVAYFDTYKPSDYVWSSEYSFNTAGLDFDDQTPEIQNLGEITIRRVLELEKIIQTMGAQLLDLESRTWNNVVRQESDTRLANNDLTGHIRQTKEVLTSVDAVATQLATEIASARGDDDSLSSKVNRIDKTLVDATQAAASALEEITAAREGEVSLQATVRTLKESVSTVDTATSTLKQEIEAARSGETNLAAKVSKIDQATANNEQVVATVASELTAARNGEESLQSRINNINQVAVNADQAAASAQSELAAARAGETNLSSKINKIDQAVVDATTSAATAQQELFAARSGAENLSARLSTIDQAVTTATTAATTAQTELTAARSGSTDLAARLAQILTAQVNGDAALAQSLQEVSAKTDAVTAAGRIRFTAQAGVAGALAALDIETSIDGSSGSFKKSGMRLLVWQDSLGVIKSKIQLNADQVEVLKQDGSALAIFDATTGKVLASAIETTSLSAITANLGTITAGIARDANSKFILDFNNARLDVYDEDNNLVMRIGKLN